MQTFSQRALTALHKAGWTESREINITRYVNMLEQKGNIVHPVVADFLKQFGGLTISFPRPILSARSDVRLYILTPYLPDLVRIVEQPFLGGYEDALHVNLCSIGVDDSSIDLVMDVFGKVYGLYGAIVFFLGNSGEEMIETYANWHPQTNPLQQIKVDWGD